MLPYLKKEMKEKSKIKLLIKNLRKSFFKQKVIIKKQEKEIWVINIILKELLILAKN